LHDRPSCRCPDKKDKERTGKTDRGDCRKLARGLRNGEIKGIYVPLRMKVEDRIPMRTRQRGLGMEREEHSHHL
jgi:hypothetical protein